MLEYVYLPVLAADVDGILNNMLEEYDNRNWPRPIPIINETMGFKKATRHFFGNGLLKVVTSNDRLFIMTHGHFRGTTEIGATRAANKELKKWNATQFANHLKKEGLTTSLKKLILLVCGSAVPKNADTKPYAESLQDALMQLNYSNVSVTGYLGNVKFTGEHGFTVEVVGPRGGTAVVAANRASKTWEPPANQ